MTIRTLRPNATLSAGGYTVTGGGGTAHGATSDVSNASYVDLLTPGSFMLLSLTSYTLAAGEAVRSYRIGATATVPAVTTSAPAMTLAVGLNAYQAIPGSLGYVWLPDVTFATFSGPSVASPLSQAEIDGLVAFVEYPSWTLTSSVERVSEVFVELVVASPPVVQNTGPFVTQTVANPTLTASFTQGADGGPQTKIRWKVFTTAQYTAGGFDPETSPATYDSGELATTATAHTVATPLATGVTYRAYVKGAHTINGVDYWSTSWHTFAAWDVTYTPTVVSSVTIVPDPPSGSVQVRVNRNTGTPAWTRVDVERSEDGGTTWVPVRGATGRSSSNTFLTWGTNLVTVNDFESPNGLTTVLWRARATNASAGVDVVGAWVQSSASGWTHSAVHLKSPTRPQLNTTVDFETVAPELTYPIEQGVFPIVGSQYPVVVSDVRQAGTAELAIETYSYASSVLVKALLDSGTVLLLHPPSGAGAGAGRHRAIYFAPGPAGESYTSVAEDDQVWRIAMQVVARPPDDTP